MGQHGDRAREALLDAAEQLFALHGIDAVSNRRIAEQAGSANHSSIAYHFGTRDELMRALISRHTESIRVRRDELVTALGPDPTVHQIVECRLLPWIEQLAALPLPSWRAQFLSQVRAVPSAAALLADAVKDPGTDAGFQTLSTILRDLPADALRARSAILGHLVLGVCADYERQRNAGEQRGDWVSVGYFLIDAITGMLSAPVTRRLDGLTLYTGGLI